MKKTDLFKLLTLGVALMSGLALTSCSKDDNNSDNKKVDPSTIASTDLVAYFPFDGNATEKVASLTPAVQPNVTYVTGRRGKAYQGADNAYLRYTLPANSKLKSLTSFSVAVWFKSPLVTGDPEPIFFQIGRSDDLYWGNLTLALNRLDANADSLQLKAFFYKDGVSWAPQHVPFSCSSFRINTWMHLIFEYDATTSKYKIFKDGVQVVTSSSVEDRYASSANDALGALKFINADVINIGAWRPKTEGTATDNWMGWFKGNLDELRVYDKALTATEAKALYDAEVSQIAE
ncbi:MAG: LamG-like jellyroll fold domain-containing protein [Bacteroidota bacterium]|nr:LamG-like jellyroll fold domain-containing protein [Bacteroidota bacterium]